MLGFDDARSTDHLWGPLLHLFLREPDYSRWADQIKPMLAAELPLEVLGFSTNFWPFEGDETQLGHLGHMQAVAHLRSTTA